MSPKTARRNTDGGGSCLKLEPAYGESMVRSFAGQKGRNCTLLVPVAGHTGFLTLAIVALAAVVAEADEAPAKVSYYKQIRPIFQEHCQGCHQPAKRSGGFDMTSVALMQKGGDSEEPAFVAAKPDESFLISQIVPDGETPPLMPKGKESLPP